MAKKQNNTIFWIIGIIIVALILKNGGITEFIVTERIIGATPSDFENTPIDPTCTFTFDKSTASVGEDVTGTIRDGALKRCVVAYNYENMGWVIASVEDLDIDGVVTETRSADVSGTYVWTALCGYFEGENFIAECRTNDETIEIVGDCTETDGGNVITVPGITTFDGLGYIDACLATDDRMIHEYWCEDDTLHEGNFMCPTGSTCFATRSGAYCLAPFEWDVGDIVGGASDSGTMPESGGIGYEFHDLTDFEVVPGGPRRLGARINTNWDYVNQEACYGMVMQEGMEWMFTDSDSVEWQVTDNFPQAHSVDLCPLDWDGTNLWFLDFWKTQNIIGCDITYEWSVEIYVCE